MSHVKKRFAKRGPTVIEFPRTRLEQTIATDVNEHLGFIYRLQREINYQLSQLKGTQSSEYRVLATEVNVIEEVDDPYAG